jgi:hypothetical protein
MKALTYRGPKHMEFLDVPVVSPQKGEVKIALQGQRASAALIPTATLAPPGAAPHPGHGP